MIAAPRPVAARRVTATRRAAAHRAAAARRAALAAAVTLALPAAANAAPPVNDAASTAVEVTPVTAENGATADRQGIADLGEATPDAGTPRCLGPSSFQRTTWFRVPGGPLQRLRLDAFVTPGQPDEIPQIAAYVQPAGTGAPLTTEPQACDGLAAGSPDAGVQLTVPAGHDVLVQVGVPGGSKVSQAILSVDADPLRQLAPPDGDDLDDPVSIAFATLRSLRMRGATLGVADPAQPACPAGHTIWRKRTIRQTGQQVIAARGRDVSTLTAFVGKRPTGDNVRGCVTAATDRTSTLAVPFTARKGDTAWVRFGADELGPQSVRAAFSGPCDPTPLDPLTRPRVRIGPGAKPRRKREIRLRVATDGPCLHAARVTVKRGRTVVARGTSKLLVRGTRTLRLRRVARTKAPRGSYRVSIAGRTPKGKRRSFGITKTVKLR